MGAELPKLTVPTLALHGDADPIAPAGPVTAYAAQVEALSARVFPGAHHDVLNEAAHAEVAAAVIAFITEHT